MLVKMYSKMKKAFIVFLCLSAFLSCKNESKSDQKEDLTLLKGDFVYYEGAAVLQTHSEIYGVLVTDKMLELNEMAKEIKKDPTDMVQVEIRGKISNQKDEKILWENKVEVVEILDVKQPKQVENNIIKLGQ